MSEANLTQEQLAELKRKTESWGAVQLDTVPFTVAEARQLLAAAENLYRIYEADGDYSQQLRAEHEAARQENQTIKDHWNEDSKQLRADLSRVAKRYGELMTEFVDLRTENEAWNSALEQFGIEPERVRAFIQNLQAENERELEDDDGQALARINADAVASLQRLDLSKVPAAGSLKSDEAWSYVTLAETEINRLRADVKEVMTQAARLLSERDSARAENERLRAMLPYDALRPDAQTQTPPISTQP